MRNSPRLVIAALCAGVGLCAGYGVHVLAEGAPKQQPLFYAGTLEDNGALANGDYSIGFALYDAASAGSKVCGVDGKIAVQAGRFRLDVSDCAEPLASHSDVWLELSFTGSDGKPRKIANRTKVGAVPYALEAQHAVSASSASGTLATDLAALTDRVNALEQAAAGSSAFHATKNAQQNLAMGSNMLVFDDEEFDYGNEYDPSTGVFTSKDGGSYEFSCLVAWDIGDPVGGVVGSFEANLFVNGYERVYTSAYTDGIATTRQVQGTFKLNPGDKVQCAAYQGASGTHGLHVGNGSAYNSFEGRRFAK